MRCESVQKLYDEYVRGSVALGTLTRIEEHLGACPTCRNHYELNDRIAKALRESTEVAHPGGDYFDALCGRVLERLEEPAGKEEAPVIALHPAGGWRRPLWWAGSVAAAALVALGLYDVTMMESGEGRSSQVAQAMGNPAPVATPPVRILRPSTGGPTVVVSANNTRRELVLTQTLPDGTTGRVAEGAGESTTLEKSSSGQSDSYLMGGTELGALGAGETAGAGRMAAQPEIQTVSRKPAENPVESFTSEINDQIRSIRQEMVAQGDEALQKRLSAIETAINSRAPVQSEIEGLAPVRQVRLFMRAQEALSAGRPMEASTQYRRIVMIDGTTPLGRRAGLALADLFYSEWADFKEAEKYYSQCQSGQAAEALTPTELDHVGRQLERLRIHAANNWEALLMLHKVRREGWKETAAALHRLMGIENTADLLPEAGRTIVERIEAGQAAPAETAIEIYNLLANRAAVEQNEGVRAWLELTLGDLQLKQFQQLHAAINHYNRAIGASTDSGAGRLAQARRDQLIDRQLLELVR